MYYFKYPYIIYRDYPDYGYLTDNRNFGYDTATKSCLKLGDRILSKTGSIFYSVLTEEPRHLSEIVQELSSIFPDVSMIEIEGDAKAFFAELSEDGFVGQICYVSEYKKRTLFSYDNKLPYKFDEADRIVDDNVLCNIQTKEYNLSRVHINVSGLCNEHCIHCYFPIEYRRHVMSKDLFLMLIEQCNECNVLNLTLSGGEPMLNPDLPYFIDICRENNYSINILSNLTLFTDELLSKFKISPLVSVQTSLYSMDDSIHDSITKVKGSFKKTKQAIEILRENNIPLQINCPIMKQNLNTYQSVLNWAKSLNIEANSDYMLFGSIDHSACNLGCRLDLAEVKKIIKNNIVSHTGEESIPSNSRNGDKELSVCPVCTNSICVSYDGDVYPCEGWQSMNLGNIRRLSLYDLWEESENVRNLRNLTIENDFPQCAVCDNKGYCSLCLIRNANESPTGNFKDINPYFCEIAKMKRLFGKNNVAKTR